MISTMDNRFFLLAVALVFAAWLALRIIRTLRFSLSNKVALITGGSRGLGLVLARQICAAGGKVALLARDNDELIRAKSDLTRRGGRVFTIQCDLLDSEQIQLAVRQTIDRFGKIDVLINNAGVIEVGPLEHMTREDFERAMGVHFWGPFELTMRVVPEMRIWGGGRIINVSSIGGKIAVPHLAPYCASKFALTGFSDALRAELARDKIYVTTVAPGAILGNALFPNFTGYAMKIINRLLPGAAGDEGNQSRAGSETRRLLPAWLTRLTDRATARNNENRVEHQAK